ncbi:hypothetical protein RRG08_017104 [Elysia crispata]|uniref:Uncharacterized protein n=1 Tax=Elysia crispata TaxID=231223 RepID=A0AAE0ZNR4_9GAST|nr:hypothetical protein RRG08_017104 [Elysia crispata]
MNGTLCRRRGTARETRLNNGAIFRSPFRPQPTPRKSALRDSPKEAPGKPSAVKTGESSNPTKENQAFAKPLNINTALHSDSGLD